MKKGARLMEARAKIRERRAQIRQDQIERTTPAKRCAAEERSSDESIAAGGAGGGHAGGHADVGGSSGAVDSTSLLPTQARTPLSLRAPKLSINTAGTEHTGLSARDTGPDSIRILSEKFLSAKEFAEGNEAPRVPVGRHSLPFAFHTRAMEVADIDGKTPRNSSPKISPAVEAAVLALRNCGQESKPQPAYEKGFFGGAHSGGWGFGFRVLGLGCWVWGDGFGVLGFGFELGGSGLWSRVYGFGSMVSGLWFRQHPKPKPLDFKS